MHVYYYNFNSIKVRLEPRSSSYSAGAGRFQFHKGAIRTAERVAGYKSKGNFNSIKVRLELVNVFCYFFRCSDFNSIKVRLELCVDKLLYCTNKFQFHKGAIRTCHLTCKIFIICNFNSIKVRLELSPTYNSYLLLYYFNSIKVRLEQCSVFFRPLFCSNFNSIKVRLEL